ncbi:hypothetical protein ACQJ5G_07030 [Helicobacter pylori]
MKQVIKRVLKGLLPNRFLNAYRHVETPKEKVEGFIKSLHPIKTEHELVRFGAKHDGGYLIPKDFKGIRTLFSPGVGNESAFEEDFYRQCKLANHNDIYIWQTSRSMNRY